MGRAGAKFDISGVKRRAIQFARLAGKGRERVVTRTVATVKRRVGTLTKAAVMEEFNIGVQNIGRRVFVESKDSSVSVYGTNTKIPLHQFGGKYRFTKGKSRSPGATAQILKGGPRKTYASSFIIKGGKKIFARKLNSGISTDVKGVRAGRHPLIALRGPSFKDMVLGNANSLGGISPAQKVEAAIEEIFTKEVDRLINVELNK